MSRKRIQRFTIVCSMGLFLVLLGVGWMAKAQDQTSNTPAGSAQQGSSGTGTASGQQTTAPTLQAGYVVRPESDKAQPGYAHTNYVLRSLDGINPLVLRAPEAVEVPGPVIDITEEGVIVPLTTTEEEETPQSMGCLYVGSPSSAGCVPTYGTGGPSSAGYGAIALVDAFDNPDASSDLATFDSGWGLAAASFTKIFANGNGDCTTPPANKGWAVESSLDIEWAHVFAPKAAIILVEACSASDKDLYFAEQVAFNYIDAHYAAGGQVSNSWGGDEFVSQTGDDPFFANWNYNHNIPIQAFASSGDCGFLNDNSGKCFSPGNNNFPSTSPWVVSAGGTSVLRDATTLKFVRESCWGDSGGGPSAVETYVTSFTGGNIGPWADFQYPIFGQATTRVTPDMSFNADPASGVSFYSLFGIGGWGIVGGTSVSSPSLAGIVNRAGNKLGSFFATPITGKDFFNAEENNLLYSQLATAKAYKANFYDVVVGSNGSVAVKSYDECTGVGSPRGLAGK
jgi:hypothetical protein